MTDDWAADEWWVTQQQQHPQQETGGETVNDTRLIHLVAAIREAEKLADDLLDEQLDIEDRSALRNVVENLRDARWFAGDAASGMCCNHRQECVLRLGHDGEHSPMVVQG